MRKSSYLPGPGFVCDLLCRFSIHYKTEEQDAFDREIESFFAAPPEELRIFFDTNIAGSSFLRARYFERFGELLPTGKYDVNWLIQQLGDPDGLIRNVTAHFFPLLSPKETGRVLSSLGEICSYVQTSGYDDGQKNRLLCFYIQPEALQKTLISEIRLQSARLRQYYDQYGDLIRQTRDSIDWDELRERFGNVPELEDYIGENDDIFFSCPIIDRHAVYSNQGLEQQFLLLGSDYRSELESIARDLTLPDLVLFGKILSESKRMKLVETLLDGRAMKKDDICSLLGLSMTATHYHVDMMSRAWMLSCESRGRTLYYSLNRSYFDAVVSALQRYTTAGQSDQNPSGEP